MRIPSSTERSWRGRYLKITSVAPIQQRKKIHDAIARRAFEICNSRGGKAGHQLEDWKCAEAEILRPLDCGFLVCDDKLDLSTDAASFEEGEIEIWAEPRRLTICGKKHICTRGAALEKVSANRESDLIFRYLDLPFEIDPAQATARFRGRTLEIECPKPLRRKEQPMRRTRHDTAQIYSRNSQVV